MAKGVQDTNFPKINLQSYLGGEAIDFKLGVSGSFDSSEGLDFRSKASQMTTLPGFTSLTSTNLSDKITAIDQDVNGIRYGVGDQGYVYKIDGSDNITQLGKLDSGGGAGAAYNTQTDQLYISSQQSISLYGQCTNTTTTPTLKVAQFGKSASVFPGVIYLFNTSTNSYDGYTDTNTGLTTQRNNLIQLAGSGVVSTASVTNTLTNTYVISSTSISENSANSCGFVPDLTPFYSISVWITTVGSGNLTLTMHDAQNNVLGTSTIAHTSVTTGFNEFVFASPGVTVVPNNIASTNGSSYHFHLTSSVSGDTAACATIAANNLEGCNFVLFAYRLNKTNNGWHPINFFGGIMLIGNGMYVATYNGGNDNNPSNTQFVRHALALDSGYESTGITSTSQYSIITAGRRSNTLGRSYQGGYIYCWDGSNSTYNIKVPCPMGTPYAPFCYNNVVYFFCNGSLFAYPPGGTMLLKVRYMNYQNTDYMGNYEHTVINPNMMDTRYNLLLMAYPSFTTNYSTKYGIYSWGSVELSYPNSFGYSYSLANQEQYNSSSKDLQIGCIKNFVDQCYMSWQYTDSSNVVHYGLDITNNASVPATNSSWSSLIWDGGARYHRKKGLRVKINFLPLPTGWTLNGWFSLDRGPQITADPYGSNLPFTAVAGATSILVNIPNGRFFEAQWGFNAVNNSATQPYVITGISAEIDALEDEEALRLDTLG